MEKTKIAAFAVSGVLAIAAGVGISVLSDDSARVAELEAAVSELQNQEPVIEFVNVTKEVEVPVNVTVIKEIEVDNGKLALVTQRLEDMGIYEDADEVVAEIEAEDVAKASAIALVEATFADELEDADLVGDEDDVELVKVYTDYEDVEIVKSDYDEGEYEFVIKAKVEDTEEDEKFYVEFTVEQEDGETTVKKVVKL